jgi:hypothetical protein
MPEEAVATQSEAPASTAQEPSGQVYNHKLGESQSPVEHTNGDADSAEPAQPPKPKEPSRYERTKRQRAALAQREAAIRQKEAQFAERERAEAQKPKRDYTLGDLQKYRGQWEQEGNFELVEAADKEIAAIQAEEEAARKAAVRTVDYPVMGTPEHRQQWEAAEAELAQADPEFMRAGTPLDTKLRAIMQSEDGNLYRLHPRGIVAAYHRAKMELLQTENSKLKEELRRYQGLTGIGAGAPARMSTGSRVENVNDFQRLSTKDQRRHLLANADKNGVPWF